MSGIRGLLSKIFSPSDPVKGTDGIGKRAKNNDSGISLFRYGFDGTIGGGNYSYSVRREGDAAVFTCGRMDYPEPEETVLAADGAILDRLDELCRSCGIARWDGFDKYNAAVCDGEGFDLSVTFCDGKSVTARGINAFPRGYREFCEGLHTILDPLRDKAAGSEEQE